MGRAHINENATRKIRAIRRRDLEALIRIDALHTSEDKPEYWQRVLQRFVGGRSPEPRFALGAYADEQLVAYVFGEVRTFEFGSGPCGWVFAVGVDPDWARRGIASELLAEIRRRFAAAGVECIRTMVDRTDVDVMRLFRSNGFVGGPYVQLELGAEPAE